MKFVFAPTYHPDRPTIVCILSDQFVRDVHMLQKMGTRFNWVGISDTELIEAQLPWMPRRLVVQGLYVNEQGPDVDAAWARARAYGMEILTEAKSKMPTLAGIMAGNWDYWNEECLRLACREAGLPFLVLMREHNLTPNRVEDADLYLRSKSIPKVDGIAVAGQQTYDFIVDLKLHPPEILRQTGFPRFDVWTAPYEPAFDRPVILFSYLKGYGATEHFVEMLEVFNRIAARHPAIPFLVKAKHRQEIDNIAQLMPARSKNLKIVDDAVLPRLAKGARAVAGFRSIVLYELLLEGAPIFVPYWGQTAMSPDLLAPGPDDERLRGFMHFLPSPEAFDAAIEDAIVTDRRAKDLSAHHAAFGHFFTHHPPERASARVERFAAEFTGRA